MIATFTVFGLVVDHRSLYLHLTGREVTLKILHVGGRVPETPLHKREELQLLYFAAQVAQRQLLDLSLCLQGDKKKQFGLHTVFSSCDGGIPHAVAALVPV